LLPGEPVRIAYCDEAGFVRVCAGDGSVIAELRTEAAPRLLAHATRGNGALLCVAQADGRVSSFALP